jgi:hypothetical protein
MRRQQITVRAVGPDAAEAVTTMIGILAEATPREWHWTRPRH